MGQEKQKMPPIPRYIYERWAERNDMYPRGMINLAWYDDAADWDREAWLAEENRRIEQCKEKCKKLREEIWKQQNEG